MVRKLIRRIRNAFVTATTRSRLTVYVGKAPKKARYGDVHFNPKTDEMWQLLDDGWEEM